MLSIIGSVIVLASVFIAYILEGGKMGVIIQPLELLILLGSAIGALITSSSTFLIKQIVVRLLDILKGSKVSKAHYIEVLQLLYELIKMAAANPLSLEAHIENPEGSELFKKYPLFLKNHHAVHFLCDTLKVQISSSLSPYDLEELMDTDLAAAHEEEYQVVVALNRTADAFPGLGIVAAVIGVVITMGKLTEGKEVIGHSVAAALVGTFMGILLCYGFGQPLTAKVDSMINEEGKYLQVIKAALLAYSKGTNAKVCAEFGRRMIPAEHRPSFTEVDEATSASGKKAA